MREQNVGHGTFAEIGVYRRTVHRVTARRISAVGPIQQSLFQIELEIDWFRQTIEQKFDISAVRGGLTLRDVDLRAEDSPFSRIVRSFLCPINLPAIRIDRDPDAPFRQIGSRTRVAFACVDQSFNVRTVDVCTHDAHSLAITPVKFAALLIEMQLLGREGFPFTNDGYSILTIEIGAFDRAVVATRNSHVGPVNVSRLNIDNDAVRNSAPGNNDFSVRPVGVSQMNPASARFEEEQAANRFVAARCAVWFGNFGNTFHALIPYFFLKFSNIDISEFFSQLVLLIA